MDKLAEMFTMWQFWAALVFMFVVWRFIVYLASLQRSSVLHSLANRLWKWQRKILHAAMVTQYAAEVSDKITEHKLTIRAESLAKQTIIMSVDPLLLDEAEKVQNRS